MMNKNQILVVLVITVGILFLNGAIVNASDPNSGINYKPVKDSIAVENEYVRVLRNSTGCHSAETPGFGSRVIVALGKLKVESNRGTLSMDRGGVAVFEKSESYRTPEGEYFEVAFKTNHPPLNTPEEWIEPKGNKIVYDGPEFRVFEEVLGPGETRELHSHAQRVVVRLNHVQLTDPRFRPDGSQTGGIQVPNTAKFAEPMVHVVKNLSKDTPLFNVVIEFKLPH